MDPTLSSAMSDFNAQDNKDMQSFLQQEQQKARFQESTHPPPVARYSNTPH